MWFHITTVSLFTSLHLASAAWPRHLLQALPVRLLSHLHRTSAGCMMQEKNEDERKMILSMKLLENMLRPSYDMSHVLHRLSSGEQSAGLFMVACHPPQSCPDCGLGWVGVVQLSGYSLSTAKSKAVGEPCPPTVQACKFSPLPWFHGLFLGQRGSGVCLYGGDIKCLGLPLCSTHVKKRCAHPSDCLGSLAQAAL